MPLWTVFDLKDGFLYNSLANVYVDGDDENNDDEDDDGDDDDRYYYLR